MTENLDIPITETPKPKRGWPKGRKRGPRKPKEAPQSAPKTPAEAPRSQDYILTGGTTVVFDKMPPAGSSLILDGHVLNVDLPAAPKPRKRARKPRYPVSLVVGKKRYKGTRVEFRGLFAIVHDAKGQEMVNLTTVPSFRLEGDPIGLTFARPQERGYDAPPRPVQVTGTTMPPVATFTNAAEREAEVRRFKEQQRRELEQSQGPEAFG